jgi:hypothetical protein
MSSRVSMPVLTGEPGGKAAGGGNGTVTAIGATA